MKRVLFSLDKYQKTEGGADKLAKGIVDCLKKQGYIIRIVQCDRQKAFSEEDNVQIKTYPLSKSKLFRDNDYLTLKWNFVWENVLKLEIAEFKPDLILTQNMLAPASVRAAKKYGIKSLVIFHGYRCISPLFFSDRMLWKPNRFLFYGMPMKHKLKWPLVRKTLQLYDQAYREADVIVANSNYISKVIERFFDRPAQVMYPVLDIKVHDVDFKNKTGNEILFVKPQNIKGLEVFLHTAQIAKDKNFLVVGTASRRTIKRISRFSNIRYLSWIDDMDSVYKSVSLLFGPSQIPEPFGRIFVEAGLNYVPSVASSAGGIPEAVGRGGKLVEMDADPEKWISAFDTVLSEKKYSDYCLKARQNAEEILKNNNDEGFINILESIFK